jgi:PTH1 family peptidyl-tRNA hydrolase
MTKTTAPSRDSVPPRVVVGLGNPGAVYDGSPHNLGFATLDELARRHALGPWRPAGDTLLSEWPAASGAHGPALLVKPLTGMNRSGKALRPLLAERVRALSDVLVVVDDVALGCGELRIRDGGGAGGHNGLRDLEDALGRRFARLRLGIGAPPLGELGPFVIGPIPTERRAAAAAMVGQAADCAERWCAWGIGAAERHLDCLRRAHGAAG